MRLEEPLLFMLARTFQIKIPVRPFNVKYMNTIERLFSIRVLLCNPSAVRSAAYFFYRVCTVMHVIDNASNCQVYFSGKPLPLMLYVVCIMF